MAKLILEIEDSSLKDAEMILDSIGLDMEIAVNIFIKKVVKEKGLPFSMKQSANLQEVPTSTGHTPADGTPGKRMNIAISEDMIQEVWNVFRKFRVGIDDIKDQSDKIAKQTGMNPGSASIYLNILLKMLNGDMTKRAMKPTDFEFFLTKFRQELGTDKYKNALKSVRDSIPYWRVNIPTFADSMESLLTQLARS
jgi:addiction module RelB/DinJ family antitoxin